MSYVNGLISITLLFTTCLTITYNNGVRIEPKKNSADNRYHVAGKLCIVDRQEMKKIFNMSVPVLRAGGDCTKIILSPLLRYSSGKCCESDHHITNFGDRVYYSGLGSQLSDVKYWLKEFTFGKRIRQAKVLNPNKLLEGGGDLDSTFTSRLAGYWREDPVHMNRDGYEFLAMGLLQKLSELSLESSEDPAQDEGQHIRGRGSQGGRGGLIGQPGWLSVDDAVAHRTDTVQIPRGRGRGGRGYRWPRQGAISRGGQYGGLNPSHSFKSKMYRGNRKRPY
jgi:hypothetical protein